MLLMVCAATWGRPRHRPRVTHIWSLKLQAQRAGLLLYPPVTPDLVAPSARQLSLSPVNREPCSRNTGSCLSVGLTRVINTHLLFLGWAVPVQKIKSWQSWHPRRHVNSDMPPSPNTVAAHLWVRQEVNELFGSRGSLKLPKRRWGAGRDRTL